MERFQIVLNAARFSDVTAIWEDTDVELRFLTDSHLWQPAPREKCRAAKQAITSQITFGPDGEALPPENIKVLIIQRGSASVVRLPQTQSVVIRYQGQAFGLDKVLRSRPSGRFL